MTRCRSRIVSTCPMQTQTNAAIMTQILYYARCHHTLYHFIYLRYFIKFTTSPIGVTRYIYRNMVYTYEPQIYAHNEYVIGISVFTHTHTHTHTHTYIYIYINRWAVFLYVSCRGFRVLKYPVRLCLKRGFVYRRLQNEKF